MPHSPKDKLLKDMKRTKGVRFNASRRLERHEKTMTTNTAYASAAVIVVTLLPAFFSLSSFLVDVVAIMTVGLSIFILATTLLHSANKSALKADQFHRCALEVNALRRELLAAEENKVEDFARRYDAILGRYNINHEDVDYDRYRLEHPDEFSEVAGEDISSARENVALEGRLFESASKAIVMLTLVVVVSTVFTVDEIIRIMNTFGSLLGLGGGSE